MRADGFEHERVRLRGEREATGCCQVPGACFRREERRVLGPDIRHRERLEGLLRLVHRERATKHVLLCRSIILRRLLEQLLAQRVIIGDPLERLTLARA